MKRILAVAVLVLAMSGMARAQIIPQNINNLEFFVAGCSTFTPQTPAPVKGAVCNDTVTGVSYFWNGTAFVLPATVGVNGTPGVSGGGALATGSGAMFGTVTTAAATGNVLTPGFTCTNKVICILGDETTAGGAKVTASSTTTCTFSATASDTVDYVTGCR